MCGARGVGSGISTCGCGLGIFGIGSKGRKKEQERAPRGTGFCPLRYAFIYILDTGMGCSSNNKICLDRTESVASPVAHSILHRRRKRVAQDQS